MSTKLTTAPVKPPYMRPRELIFIYMPGCPACDAAKPALLKFANEHPEVPVKTIDITEVPWPENAVWRPTVTPTFVLYEKGFRPRSIEGHVEYEKLENWVLS